MLVGWANFAALRSEFAEIKYDPDLNKPSMEQLPNIWMKQLTILEVSRHLLNRI